MVHIADFDRYCDEHNIQPGEEAAAFGAFLNQETGWDSKIDRLDTEEENT